MARSCLPLHSRWYRIPAPVFPTLLPKPRSTVHRWPQHQFYPQAAINSFLRPPPKKARALKRHAFLLPLNKDIKLETTDSVTYNISIVLPGTPADTLRLKDSLNAWYYGTKPIKVRIEQ